VETSLQQKPARLRHPLFEIWDAFRVNRGALLGLIVIVIIALSAVQ